PAPASRPRGRRETERPALPAGLCGWQSGQLPSNRKLGRLTDCCTCPSRRPLRASGPDPAQHRSPPPMAMDFIRIRGARTHTLKNIDLDLPRDKLIVITGLSGSGKSSLAFDTIYAEGQRRYVES